MTTVIIITAACLYFTGIIIAAGDALAEEVTERDIAQSAELPVIRADSIARMHAARRRLRWSALWPLLLAQALWRLLHETTPRHRTTTRRRHTR
jgi:hypothetical protein